MIVCWCEFGHWMCGESWYHQGSLTHPFPVLKAGHSVSYSYICDVCLEWINGRVSFYILKFLFG